MKAQTLFLAPFVSGLLAYLIPSLGRHVVKLLVVLAGAYLFAVTASHTLSELWANPDWSIGALLCIALGFLLQRAMEYIALMAERRGVRRDEPSSLLLRIVPLLCALCIHAFLEGGMIVQLLQKANKAVFFGVLLHRMPVAFVMMALLSVQLRSKKWAILCLLIFSLAAPAGMWVSEYLSAAVISPQAVFFLCALMSGGFLYMVMTAVVEKPSATEPSTRAKTLNALLGFLLAVAVEHLL